MFRSGSGSNGFGSKLYAKHPSSASVAPMATRFVSKVMFWDSVLQNKLKACSSNPGRLLALNSKNQRAETASVFMNLLFKKANSTWWMQNPYSEANSMSRRQNRKSRADSVRGAKTKFYKSKYQKKSQAFP